MHVLRDPRIGCDYQALLCFSKRRPHVFQDDINVHSPFQSVVYTLECLGSSHLYHESTLECLGFIIMFVQPLKLSSVNILFTYSV